MTFRNFLVTGAMLSVNVMVRLGRTAS